MADRPRHGLGGGRATSQGRRDGDVSLVAWGGCFASGEAGSRPSARLRRSAPFSAGSLSPRGFRPADGAGRRDFAAGSCKPLVPHRVSYVWLVLLLPRPPTALLALVASCCHGSTPWRTSSAPPSNPPTTSSGLASGICCRGACAACY